MLYEEKNYYVIDMWIMITNVIITIKNDYKKIKWK